MFNRTRITAALIAALLLLTLCGCSAAPEAEPAPAVITPAPILAELPLTADGETVDYQAYILGEWVTKEPVVDGTWHLASKYVADGIVGMYAAAPKGDTLDFSNWDEEHWTFGEITPGTYEITGSQMICVVNGESIKSTIAWEYYDVMVLTEGLRASATYYRVR